VARIAVLSYHTSPLAQPGTGDGGGMNVYVREMGAALARHGHDVTIYTRRDEPSLRDEVHVEPGLRVRHITAGPASSLSMDALRQHLEQFTDSVSIDMRRGPLPDVIHANYWLSGIAGHRLKHELDIPLICTFHTLERIKAATFQAESEERAEEEQRIIGCSDAILASCDVEAHQIVEYYHANPARVHIVPLGVEHAFFSPGPGREARLALHMPLHEPLLLFAGRIQALKGADLALEAFLAVRERLGVGHLAIVGGPSGPHGLEAVRHLRERIANAGVIENVSFVAPQSHQLLSTWYRAADLTLVPSLAESFGLVALESTACGTPVIASAVGGLTTLVHDHVNGRLLSSREPQDWSEAIVSSLDATVLPAMRDAARLNAATYTWCRTARAIGDLVERLQSGALLLCR
jgi:D-inositol-3-phosphate glycosyltransferase